MSQSEDVPQPERSDGLVPRPQGQLALLPFEYRWEAVRRHPYYLLFWEDAQRYHQGASAEDIERHYIAACMLGAAGIHAPPVDPRVTYDQLDGNEIHPAWASGAVIPVTARKLAILLETMLPPDDRFAIGKFLMDSARCEASPEFGEIDKSIIRFTFANWLATIASPPLDRLPDFPLYLVSPEASGRTITKDMEALVKNWKRRKNIPEHRVQTKKFSECLEVWDQREGWSVSGYSLASEKTYAQIAKQRQESVSEVRNAHYGAFKLITGHEFTHEKWWALFGLLKFGLEDGNSAALLSAPMRHRLKRGQRRPVSDSVVSRGRSEEGATGVVELESAIEKSPDSKNMQDMMLDICQFVDEGMSNEQIAQRFELDDVSLVANVVQRLKETDR